jgi:anti-sigma regulatory factor (Ser/Thr protein kinase)
MSPAHRPSAANHREGHDEMSQVQPLKSQPTVCGDRGAPQLRLELKSNPLYLSAAREMVFAAANRLGFSEEACGQIALAVDEAICNIIRHGYERCCDRPIWLSVYADGGVATPDHKGESPTRSLRFVLEDEARQVDLSQIRSRDLDEIRPGGLGVHIIQQVMDEVRYEHRQPCGMRLTMVKHRTLSSPPPSTSQG